MGKEELRDGGMWVVVGGGDGVRGVGDWPVMVARSRHRGTIPAYLRGMRGARGVWRREAGHGGRLGKCPKIIYVCTLLIFIVILLPRLLLLVSFFTVMRKFSYKVRKLLVVVQKRCWTFFLLLFECQEGGGRGQGVGWIYISE